MRVLFTSIRDAGHFLPLVPFIEACRERGHEVAVAAPTELAERVAGTGAQFFSFGHPGDERLRPIWGKLREVSTEDANRMVISEIFAGLCAQYGLPELLVTLERWKPSIVVRESQEYAAVLACEKLGIPRARVSIMMGSMERMATVSAAPSLASQGQALGLALDSSGQRLQCEPALSLFPPSYDFSEGESAAVRRFRTPRKPARPLPAWWGDRTGPLVYVTLGTVAGSMDDKAAYRCVLDAVSALPVRVLLTVGKVLPFESLGTLPANVHVERFVPQDDVLPHAAAVVCHGGSGTVVGTLAAGVPMVVTPLFADQPQNAARVQAVGAGLALPPRAASVDDTRSALSRVLEEPTFRAAAQGIAAEISALPPVADAPAALEQIVREHSVGA